MSQKAICDYLHIGKKRFKGLLAAGMPVVNVFGGWIGNKDTIDEFISEKIDQHLPAISGHKDN